MAVGTGFAQLLRGLGECKILRGAAKLRDSLVKAKSAGWQWRLQSSSQDSIPNCEHTSIRQMLNKLVLLRLGGCTRW